MFKNVASQSVELFAFDTTTGAPKTGDSANMVFYVTKDFGTVTAIAASSGVPTEMDATNAKGVYKIALSQAETNADHLTFTGKSSTSNVSVVAKGIDTYPANFSALSIDATGVAKANLAQILGTAITETAGQIAAGFKKVFDVATPVFTAASVNQTGDNYPRLGAPAGASHAADVAAVKVDTAAVKVQTDKLTFTVANQVDSNVLDWKGSAAPAMTGDAFARLGAPAGASVSADIAAVKSDTGTILTDVNSGAGAIYTRIGAPAGASLAADVAAVKAVLPTALTGAGNIKADVLALNGDTTSAANIAKTTRAIARGTVSGSPSTTSIPTSAFTPTGAVADQFKGRIVTFDADTTTIALRGQSTDITASSNSATPTLTVTALTSAPVSGDTFSVT